MLYLTLEDLICPQPGGSPAYASLDQGRLHRRLRVHFRWGDEGGTATISTCACEELCEGYVRPETFRRRLRDLVAVRSGRGAGRIRAALSALEDDCYGLEEPGFGQ